MPTVASQLDAARLIIAQADPDIEDVQALLANLPINDLDVQTCDAVQHARMLFRAGRIETLHNMEVARFALARVIVLLERHVALTPQRRLAIRSDGQHAPARSALLARPAVSPRG